MQLTGICTKQIVYDTNFLSTFKNVSFNYFGIIILK